jgi:hypothetical protein
MELKNALTVCLISLFSATVVLLIARVLDLQAAARLEPQLIKIADELETLRKQGGLAATRTERTGGSRLVVYYFHGNTRCPTCRAVESQTHEVVRTSFAAELASEAVAWKPMNYEEPSGAGLGQQFDVVSFAVVLAKMQGDVLTQWKRLDRAGALVGDKSRFADYVREEIKQLLRPAGPPPGVTPPDDRREATKSAPQPADTSVPAGADLPVPE